MSTATLKSLTSEQQELFAISTQMKALIDKDGMIDGKKAYRKDGHYTAYATRKAEELRDLYRNLKGLKKEVFAIFPQNDDRFEWFMGRIEKCNNPASAEAIKASLADARRNLERRMAQGMTDKDMKDTPAPDMTKNKKSAKAKKEESIAATHIISEKDAATREAPRPRYGTEGEHVCKITDFEVFTGEARGWGRITLEDENRFQYFLSVWCAKEPSADACYTKKDGSVGNYSEDSALGRIVSYIIGYDAKGNYMERAYNHFAVNSCNDVAIINSLKKKAIPVVCYMVPRKDENGEIKAVDNPHKQFKIWFSEPRMNDEGDPSIELLEDSGEDVEFVPFDDNRGLGSHESKGMASRPTEEKATANC